MHTDKNVVKEIYFSYIADQIARKYQKALDKLAANNKEQGMKINLTGGEIVIANDGVVINGKEYNGKSISICNGEIIIDGKSVDKVGQVNSIESGAATVTIHGDVGSVKTQSGDVNVSKNVAGSIKTMSGDVTCGVVYGDVETMSGDINNG